MESSRTLVLQDVVAELVSATGKSEDLCKTFVKCLFAAVGDQLVANGEVTLKGIGRFAVVDGNVQFEADAEAAAFVNGAFDCFEPMELAEDFDGEENAVKEETPKELPAEEEQKGTEKEETEPESEEEEILPPPVPSEDKPVEEPTDDGEEQSEGDEESTEDVDKDENDEWLNDEEAEMRGHRFLWGFLSGFASAAVIAVAAYFFVPAMLAPRVASAASVADSTAEAGTVAADTVKPAEAVEEPRHDSAPKQVEEEPVGKEQTFTVTNTAYLSNISRKFYGHYAFWVYIYLENKDIISDPDNLPVGATLKIPAPEKYGIDKNSPESIKRAEIKALELKKGE